MNIPKIENMLSPRTGNPVANQFKILTDDGVFFQSYSTIIAFKPYGDAPIQLDLNAWDYSVTTSKYRNQFLNMTTAEVKTAIKSGEIILTDLNK